MTDLQRTEQQSTPDLTVTEALELAATDAPELAARLRRGNKTLTPSLWPSKNVQHIRTLRWRWWLDDPAGGNTLADGYSLFEAWAWHRASAKAAEIYIKRLADRKGES